MIYEYGKHGKHGTTLTVELGVTNYECHANYLSITPFSCMLCVLVRYSVASSYSRTFKFSRCLKQMLVFPWSARLKTTCPFGLRSKKTSDMWMVLKCP